MIAPIKKARKRLLSTAELITANIGAIAQSMADARRAAIRREDAGLDSGSLVRRAMASARRITSADHLHLHAVLAPVTLLPPVLSADAAVRLGNVRLGN